MPGKLDYLMPKDHDPTSTVIWSHNDLSCCGVCHWSFSGSWSELNVERELKIVASRYMNHTSVAMVNLKATQVGYLEPMLLKFGFVKTYGPIRNVNTGNDLYGYVLDLNKYRDNESKKLQQSAIRK